MTVVYGVQSPLTTVLCLKLVQKGARLVLVGEAESLALDLNLIWGGLDTNHATELHTDPWGAVPIATALKETHSAMEVVEHCLNVFGRDPDMIVDLDQRFELQSLRSVFRSQNGSHCICIQPFDGRSLWSSGWFGGKDCPSIQEENKPFVSFFVLCDQETIQSLQNQLPALGSKSNLEEILLFQTDDGIPLLSFVLHSRNKSSHSEFQIALKDSNPEQCRRRLVTLQSTSKTPPFEEKKSKNAEMAKDSLSEVVELEGYWSSEWENNRTFDAALQKSKDYPIDWWEGGCDSKLAVDDINYKVMTRAAVNFTVRWLVLGYFVIGFAVPKALGWDAA